MSLPTKQQDSYRSANADAARLILAERERYGGDGAALVEWAKIVLAVGGITQPKGQSK